jgi:hypothetical protein
MQRALLGSFFLGLAGTLLTAGCAQRETVKPPPTVSVKGMVLDKNKKPFPGGSIEFRLISNPEFTTMGIIQDDGSFTLRTIAGNANIEGVQEGDHKVTIVPKIGAVQDVKPILLKKPVTVKAGDSQVTVIVDQ